ncbi:MAG: hypothetical protein IJT37_08580 [Lachnospiraceae bacterium]|nr:hypothetical protein [Lachnospiraceae bacterium]
MKKKVFRTIILAMILGALTFVCTACDDGNDYNSWHNKQVEKGVKDAEKIYKGR